ncbi:restriction endonuclease subunit S [Mycobacteroides abscessus]|uniref:restriction endonuclease subunit S n=1 Tax=Mycobacteroides abscessus TaxID=36809 RepID=UPI00092974A0|nr:restriction endonuclease subunit S [Mycobacteroides abscessus]SHO84146.1 restriction endonuclease S subunit [Mycobacteroides abscessus subsp. abscessus]SHP00614.1 restriction endonuclease S subunit [Mycobacteroides abscessus subsp. abscessus]SHP51577.1 restriction endonuclease S subunit [Mycobacteroides abscessus subsp. abscessus]SHP67264.1 restriction endonuclease S subunit [Mycobacteroides abscessus subsp. abscessus]SHP73390.1 restriction endonuclease S subunit [Mycobacteroides abscessus 
MSTRTTQSLGERTVNLDRRRVPVKSADRRPGPYPYYGASGIVDHVDNFLFDGLHLLVAEDGENLRSRKTRIAFLADGQFWVNNHAHVLISNDDNDIRFLAYALEACDITGYITGSAQPKLTQAALASIPITAPGLDQQRSIAATLAALDDKFESNRRLQLLVLDLAENIYREACAHDADSVALKDAGRWLSGGTPRTSEPSFWGGDLPWISAASLKSFYVSESDRSLTEAGAAVATNIAPAGSVLLVVRGMSLKTEFRFGIAQRSVAFGQDCKAILPKINSAVLATALYSVTDKILELVDEAGHGTGRLQTDRLEQVQIAVPRDPTISQILDALLARGGTAARENRMLTSLRDALLPELLTGRMRVHKTTPRPLHE